MLGVSAWQLGVAADGELALTLDKISFQLTSKTWVSTQTAVLKVTVNASLDADLVQARTKMMANLAKIASGDWHIVRFDRFQDSSGLEKLSVLAQLRVAQKQLVHLYDKAKQVSKPGETYQIAGIEFTPELTEIQSAKAGLRQTLNQRIQQELAHFNQTFPEQHFTLSAVTYQEGEGEGPQQPMLMAAGVAPRMGAAQPAVVSLSNEVVMTANVEAGSVRK